jgi:hypothetical protein
MSSMPEASATEADFALARKALLEITSADSIGAPAGSIDEGDNVTTVYFDTLLAGYPGWRWTVSIAHVDGEAPTALETELTPGESALLSPAWVPWVDRLADYRAAQDDVEADADDAESDDESDDDEDDDDLGSDVLHGGDLDGVDIDDDTDDDTDDGSDDDSDDELVNDLDDDLVNDLDDHIPDDDDLEPLVLPPLGVEQAEESESESDDAGPEQPESADGDELVEDDEEHDKSY